MMPFRDFTHKFLNDEANALEEFKEVIRREGGSQCRVARHYGMCERTIFWYIEKYDLKEFVAEVKRAAKNRFRISPIFKH